MDIINFKQINFRNNGIRLLIVLATIFIVWNNVQNVTLNIGGSLHAFNAYFCSPMLFVILISFGFLSANNNFSWKEYSKLILAIMILSLITSFMYLDFFAFKEGYVTTGYMIGLWFKLLFFDYGKWMIWIIIGGSALVKVVTNHFSLSNKSWNIVKIITLVITSIFLIIVLIFSINLQLTSKLYWYDNFNWDLFYVSFREGGFLQLIPGLLAFLVGLNFQWWINWEKIKDNVVYSLLSFSLFIVIISCRMIFYFPLIYWDIMEILQALFLFIPFIMLNINYNKTLAFLFHGTTFILFFHIAFNKIISVEFMTGLLLRLIFGLNVARRAVEFVNNNFFVTIIYSFVKMSILIFFCAFLSRQYVKLFKFKVFAIEKKKAIIH
ncbi:hypothetical protein [Spiroplasma endosymbiont of Tricholauxania praeusta]|uniref:hypothetical protein n=1 Tax=Spiroplasma endosymbiont of Tricholauxania praeusta TaxID=3066296 RepID=UPI0030D58A25